MRKTGPTEPAIPEKRNATPTRSQKLWQYFWLSFLFVSLGYAWYSFYVPSNRVVWAEDFESAKQQAQRSNKPMILFFTAEWCVPCRIMKRTVWADDQVESRVNDAFVPVAIDPGELDGEQMMATYGVGSTPTTIITDSEGNVLERRDGGISKNDFMRLLGQADDRD